jgi:pimeloyl-ACP methyl ester carboxylesterase
MKLFYRTLGEGTPLVIIHGLFGMSDNWITIAKVFAEKFKVILPDLRNHGNSPHSIDFNINVMAEDINKLFQRLGISSAFVIGHSLGGRIAISLALQYPEIIEKLIVVDIAPRKYTGNKNITNLLEVMTRIDFSMLKTFSQIEKKITQFIWDKKFVNLLLKNIKKTDKGYYECKLNFPVIKSNIETLMCPIIEKNTFKKPVMFLKGELSDFIVSEDEQEISRYFPDAKIITVKNAGHWVHADAPKEFIQQVNSFLEN